MHVSAAHRQLATPNDSPPPHRRHCRVFGHLGTQLLLSHSSLLLLSLLCRTQERERDVTRVPRRETRSGPRYLVFLVSDFLAAFLLLPPSLPPSPPSPPPSPFLLVLAFSMSSARFTVTSKFAVL
jgi:hypothetical protein